MKIAEKELVEGVKCKPVSSANILNYINDGIFEDMKRTMSLLYGVGLAAPQVGINRNFFIMKYGNTPIICINPSWKPHSKKQRASRESCLTYNRFDTACVMRYKTIDVEYTNEEGIQVYKKLTGIDAIIFQHESDHLIGKTIFYRGVTE